METYQGGPSRPQMNRRVFLRASTVATAAAWTGASALVTEQAASGLPARRGARTPDLKIALRARRGTVAILPGARTPVWRYTGKVRSGASSALQQIPGSYLGPIIRARTGQRVRVDFTNRLNEESIIHWHGLHVPADMDGHPRFAVNKGGSYTYEFDVMNRAGMYWYHPHPHGRTAPQVYNGLAGLFIISDAEEDSLGLPAGDYDIPLVIQDRMFGSDNRFQYGGFMGGGGMGGGGPMTGMLGGSILVNGAHDPVLEVEARPYRLRLLNGSNSRIYKLAWEDGALLTAIASDGGLLAKPVTREYITLAPAERAEIWVDFGTRAVGTELILRSLPFSDGMTGFGVGRLDPDHDDGEVPQGAERDVLTVRVVRAGSGGNPLPSRLSRIRRYDAADAVNATSPRRFEFAFDDRRWAINGRTFAINKVASDETVQKGTLEIWELVNAPGSGFGPGMGGGMGPMMPHPVHLHGQQFQVLDRSIDPDLRDPWNTVRQGYLDEGWKDTVLLMPGETVRILRRFDDYDGTFLYHCHNLEHEDAGMMRNFLVV